MALLGLLISVRVEAQAMQGILLFEQHCAQCHNVASPDGRAPDRNTLKQLPPERILSALTDGAMKEVGRSLSNTERRVLSEQLTGRPLGSAEAGQAAAMKNRCPSAPLDELDGSPIWNGWGNGAGNSRFQPAPGAGLSAAAIPKLSLKWAFAFPGGASAFGQPTVAAGRVFVGSDIGFVYALNRATGCVYWSFQTEASVRTAIVVARVNTATGPRTALFFGDLKGYVYAIDAGTAALLWRKRPDPHSFARITGTPIFDEGRLFVPLSSFEEVSASNPKYECCTSRGGVVAYDAATGAELWRTYMVPEPARLGRNAAGTQLWGPSGASVWSAPTIDRKRRALYVGTGNAYTTPASETTDAIVALSVDTGARLWVRQLTPKDAWVVGCTAGSPGHANCPQEPGPDFDFGSSPILRTLPDGRDVIAVGQKSGVAWGLDADKQGAILWERRVGRGSAGGGIVWGSAADERHAYFAVSDGMHGPTVAGGLSAVSLATGELVWHTRPPTMVCGDRSCTQAQPAAVSAMPGVVFSGSTNGVMRAYSTSDGRILWEYNAVKEYDTVNGVPGKGGTFNGPGPAIAGGMVLFNSGYAYVSGGIPGNVLLAFGAD